ncbi:YegP family protein, partial [Candidatus Bathyarchaeota archaeon]|nr:YegP family protein [Candidatus Bathyarchaeota archaeon]
GVSGEAEETVEEKVVDKVDGVSGEAEETVEEKVVDKVEGVSGEAHVGTGKVPQPQFEIFKDAAGKHRFRLRSENGEIIATSEAYESRAGCDNGIAAVRADAPIAVIQDLTE